jgi:hypothetical protein
MRPFERKYRRSDLDAYSFSGALPCLSIIADYAWPTCTKQAGQFPGARANILSFVALLHAAWAVV